MKYSKESAINRITRRSTRPLTAARFTSGELYRYKLFNLGFEDIFAQPLTVRVWPKETIQKLKERTSFQWYPVLSRLGDYTGLERMIESGRKRTFRN